MQKIPAHDLPRATVNHADEISPTHRWSSPDLGHVRLPDLIRLCCFHTAPLFPSPVLANVATEPASSARASPASGRVSDTGRS
jgi:hypothetical protein